MRTLHFVENYLQKTETFIYNYIQKSAELGETAIVTFDIINEALFPLPEKVKVFQIPKDPAFRRADIGKLHWVLLAKYFGKKIWYNPLKEIITEFKPDVVHCHFGVTGVYFTDFEKFTKTTTPFITNFYGYDASELPQRDPDYAKGLTRLWTASTYILAEGPAMGRRLEALGAPAKKVRLSPIIVDGRRYPETNKVDANQHRPFSFLLVGRFVEKKGFHLFLQAMGRIKEQLPPCRIVFIGAGPMMDSYLAIIKNYGLEQMVVFEGMKTLEECKQYLLETDVLVQPSVMAANGDSEGGAPTILIEAQMMGVPVIASQHADIPYVMGYDDYLAKEGDVEDLCRVILDFVKTDSLKEKILAGKEKVRHQHDLNLSSIYGNLLTEFTH